jgi:hypothetical protein
MYDKIYRPAPKRDPEAVRRCKVDNTVLHRDGSRHEAAALNAYTQGSGSMLCLAVGKEAAGRKLDGCEWSEFPA